MARALHRRHAMAFVLVGSFVAAVVVGSLAEYAAHRLMHVGVVLRRRHRNHHRHGTAQGVLPEFGDYLLGSLPMLGAGLLWSVPAGVGFAVGGLAYGLFAAWAHQLQHERPELVFWMTVPLHRLHHDLGLWHGNFGIATDLWDRVFGTWVPTAWAAPRGRGPRDWRQLVRVRWI